jgi:hypothetical protein
MKIGQVMAEDAALPPLLRLSEKVIQGQVGSRTERQKVQGKLIWAGTLKGVESRVSRTLHA